MLDGHRLLVLGGLLVALWACSETVTRPSPIGCDDDDGCANPGGGLPPTGVGSGSAGSGSSGAGGEGGGGGLPPPLAGTLAGSVQMIVDTDLAAPTSLDSSVEIRTAGATQSEVSVETGADGSYRLEGVLPNTELWVAVGTFQTPPVGPFLDTLQVVDATVGDFLNLLVMRESVMNDIAEVSFSSSVVEVDPARGHAILSFFDEDGASLAGVRVVDPTPADAAIAYDAGDVYSDQLDETANRGAVVLMNLPAVAYPGALINVTVTLDGLSYSTPVRIARGAVTVVNAQLGP
jgi:hypothetical protein